MKTKSLASVLFVAAIAVLSSCTTINHSMKSPNVLVELEKEDFKLSDQVTGEAKSTQILLIDWARIFKKETGTIEGGGSDALSLASIPVIGPALMDKTSGYALYNMMKNNPGYDVVFYPQYEVKVNRPFLGIGFIVKKTTVKSTARLGKL